MLQRSRNLLIALALVVVTSAAATARADSGRDKFYRAHYLEHVEGDFAAASKLYEAAVKDRKLDGQLAAKARAGLASCREALASGNFAKLMPPDALVYVELRRPGNQLRSLLDQLGLLADASNDGGPQIAVSPKLISELVGIRGLAVAVTGFDPQAGMPKGVAIFDHGDLEVVRALIETGLSAAGNPTDPIGGFVTYAIEDKAFVTLTNRLVVAATGRAQIEGVVQRLSGDIKSSLASSGAISESDGPRDDDLLFFFVNAKAVVPMVRGMIGSSREAAMAQALLDLDSMKSLTGRIGIADDGVGGEFALNLDENHRSMVFNLLRTPFVGRDVLEYIPEGVAAFMVGALNEAPSRYSAGKSSPNEAPTLTFLDFGREIFANIVGFSVFALPPDGSESNDGPPIPDIAAVMTVMDPSKSEALWTSILGVAAMFTGAETTEGSPIEIAGVRVRTYELQGVGQVYFGMQDNAVLVASTKTAMSQAIHAKRSKRCVIGDSAFAKSIKRISSETTKATFIHAGRTARIVKRFMSEGEAKEIQPFLGLLAKTVVSLVVDHSGESFRLSGRISGIPRIGPMVSQFVAAQRQEHASGSQLRRAMSEERWDDALAAVEAGLAGGGNARKLLQTKFRILAVGLKDREAAARCVDAIIETSKTDATALNNFAWALLTESRYKGRFGELALRVSEQSNQVTDHGNWMFLDTLALAKFETGDVEAAASLQKKAIKLAGTRRNDELAATLARFESVLNRSELADGGR